MLQKIRFSALLIALMYIVNTCSAQNPVIDSLKQFVATAKNDTNKVKALNNIAFELSHSKPEEGVRYAKMVIVLSDSLGWKLGLIRGYNSLGTNYKAQSQYPKALESYQKALTISEELGVPQRTAIILMNIGHIYRSLLNSDKAMEYYKKALLIAEETDSKKLTAQLLGSMGNIYTDQQKYEKSYESYERALKLFRELNDRFGESHMLGTLGDLYAIKKDFNKAMEYQQKAMAIYDELGNLSYKSTSLENIGLYYYNMATEEKDGNVKKALLKNAIIYFNQAVEILKELNDVDYLKQVYLSISNSQALLGDYENAFSNYQAYTNIKDSIFSLEAKESITNLETKRELELRDKEIVIQQLKKRTERIYMFAGVLFLLVVIGFIAAGYRSQKKSKNLISLQKNIVEEKQKEIVDSTNYAKRIQYALLAHHEFLKKHLPDYLFYLNPRILFPEIFIGLLQHLIIFT